MTQRWKSCCMTSHFSDFVLRILLLSSRGMCTKVMASAVAIRKSIALPVACDASTTFQTCVTMQKSSTSNNYTKKWRQFFILQEWRESNNCCSNETANGLKLIHDDTFYSSAATHKVILPVFTKSTSYFSHARTYKKYAWKWKKIECQARERDRWSQQISGRLKY